MEFVPQRAVPALPIAAQFRSPRRRLRGRCGSAAERDGLYWSLRAAGASPQVAAQYLAALATQIDVGEVGPDDGFDLVLGSGSNLLYAGLNRAGQRALQLVKWNARGEATWIDAANVDRPQPAEAGMTGRSRGTSPPISAIAIIQSCTSRAFTPASTSVRAGAARSWLPRMARSPRRVGPAAMDAK